MIKSFEEEFTSILQDLQESRLDAIGNGQASDFADYKRVCGTLQGMREAHDIFMQLVHKYRNSAEDMRNG